MFYSFLSYGRHQILLDFSLPYRRGMSPEWAKLFHVLNFPLWWRLVKARLGHGNYFQCLLLWLLLNQSWVHMPLCSKTNLLASGCDEGKCRGYCRSQARSSGMYRSKGLDVVQGEVFKDRARERVADCVTSSWTFSRLVDGEVIRSQHHQPSGSNWSRVYKLFHLVGFQYLWKAQNTIYNTWGRNKGPWLFLRLTMISLSCLTVFLCFCIFSLNLTKFILWNLRRPKRLVFFYKQETGRRHKEGEVSQKRPIWDRIQKRGWATNVQPGFGSYFWLKKKKKIFFFSYPPEYVPTFLITSKRSLYST